MDTFTASRILIVTIKVIPATNTKGTRMKLSHGTKHGAKTVGYHSVNGYEEAAVNYIAERYHIKTPPVFTSWHPITDNTVAVALAY